MAAICLLNGGLRHFSLIFWIPFLLFEIIQLVAYHRFGTVLGSEVILSEVLDASWSDMLSFVNIINVLGIILALVLASGLSLMMHKITRQANKYTLFSFGFGSLLLASLEVLVTAPSDRQNSLNNLWPLYEVKSLIKNIHGALTLNDELVEYLKALPSPAKEESSINSEYAEQGIVLIVHLGESVRADRLGLNGYMNNGLSTTPWLDAQKNKSLINFSNCISSAPFTCAAMITIMTDARRDVRYNKGTDFDARVGSILDLFAVNEFSVYSFLGTNTAQTGKFDRVTSLLTVSSKEKYYAPGLSHTSLPQIGQVLNTSPGTNKVLFINNEGSHAPFFAYDEEQAPFHPSIYGWGEQHEHPKELSNAYDNTIHYTDSYFRKITDMLKGRPFIYLYVSDHGEYVGEDGRWFRGGFFVTDNTLYPTTSACRVGMFIIASPEFEALHPHLANAVQNLRKHADMTVGHEHIFHTLLGIFGISSPYYDARLDLSGDNPAPYTGPQPESRPSTDYLPTTPQPAA